MTWLGIFKRQPRPRPDESQADLGILVFSHTSEVIRAEKLLKTAGWQVRVMGPPSEIQSGCDLVIEFPLIEELNLVRTLEAAQLSPLQIVPVSSPLMKPVKLFQVKDFGRYLMVRAANMKLTVDQESQVIVNVSGGGCPDVPYLAQEMVGKTLTTAPRPKEIGHTLCGYALQLAFEEIMRQCSW
ncbi:MAG: hypothetical protein BZ151_01745 [Desulfobacca sp. 4484_104]|nr:MAG: hypothetical protein BZ151_01745 [Desulfobacca sp. 4484_104]RLA88803.1 MAG: hypothetical protein DRG58_06990 [Deltaproteobacteria bacterium]